MIEEKIYEILETQNRVMSANEVFEVLGESDRTYVSKMLQKMKTEGRVYSERRGRSILYGILDKKIFFENEVMLKGVHEDEIWEEIRKNADFEKYFSERVETILYFAFTEMLNNAVDHSKSSVGYLKVWVEEEKAKFIVRDKGIGVFRNIMTKKRLPDEISAIQELVKGKQTTMPRWHSGEGIFWTSKLADLFILSSYGIKLIVDNSIHEYAIDKNEKDKVVGSEVYFEISVKTDKSLQKLFEKYALEKEKYSFSTTEIPVKLFEEGEIWISRSQAKKILAGLEKYKKIIFDFKGIELIGQGFADEIFRVFRKMHPEIILEPINMNKSVKLMVGRALNDKT